MELKQLTAFVAIADTLSFSRASEALFISQSAISKQIALLESDLNTVLLHRDTHSVMLTEAGASFLENAREILDLCSHARQSVRSPRKNVQHSSLTISIESALENTSRLMGAIMQMVSRMHELYPDVEVKCSAADSNAISTALQNGTIDLAVMLHELENVNYLMDTLINSRPFFYDETVIVMAKSHQPKSEGQLIETLKSMNVAYLMSHLASLSISTKLLDGVGLHPYVKFCASYSYLLTQVSCGNGYTLLPAAEFKGLNTPLLCCYSVPNAEVFSVGVIRWKKTSFNPNVQRFVSVLDEFVPIK